MRLIARMSPGVAPRARMMPVPIMISPGFGSRSTGVIIV